MSGKSQLMSGKSQLSVWEILTNENVWENRIGRSIFRTSAIYRILGVEYA